MKKEIHGKMVQSVLCSVVLFQLFLGVASQVTTCSFSDLCQCSTNLNIICANLTQFPTFTPTVLFYEVNQFLISGNYTTIPAQAFHNLETLGVTAIYFQRVGDFDAPLTIDAEAFAGTVGPFYYGMTFDNFYSLNTVPTEALTKATTLISLFIYGSNIVTLSNGSFSGLHLQTVFLSGNNIQTVEDDAFIGLKITLTKLVLRESLTAIPVQALQELSRLQTLDLGSNKISEVPSYSFSSFNELRALNLSDNLITNVQPYAFSSKSLRSLSLSNNPIGDSELSSTSFANASQLENLSLDSCQLTTIPTAALQPVATTLSTLGLAKNNLSTIPSNAFSQFPQLQLLDLSYNPLNDESLSSTSFYNLSRLKQIRFDSCRFTSFPTSALQPAANTLTSLRINNNLITTIPSYAFQNFPNLQTLEFLYNPITSIQPYAFAGLSGQYWLLESLNELETVSFNAFSGLTYAIQIGFENCDKLSNIEYTDASKLPPSIQYINLNSCPSMATVDSSVEDWLKLSEANQFTLAYSPAIYCNTSLSWMYQYVFCETPQQINIPSDFCSNVKSDFKSYLLTLQTGCQ